MTDYALDTTVEFGPGLIGRVVGRYPALDAFILMYDSQYAACYFDDDGFYLCVEEDAWRESLTDATCDLDIWLNLS